MKQKIKIFKRALISFSILMLLLNPLTVALAEDAPSAPTPPPAPEAPVAPTPPPAPEAPTPSSEPTPQPSTTPSPSSSPSPSATPTPDNSTSTQTDSTSQTTSESITGQSATEQTGSTTIETGSATNSSAAISQTNLNYTSTPIDNSLTSNDSITAANTDNGSNSTNTSSVTNQNNQTTQQTNTGVVTNDLSLNTLTGGNNASKNVSDSSIISGDANTSGTVITAVNTNIDGVSVSEFNVNDNHTGDIVLAFPQTCTTSCTGLTTATNSENGSNSTNTSTISELTNTNTFQNNEGEVGSTLTLVADSGHNTALQNTGGDSTITTGDTNASGNVLTFLNNNLSGNVLFGVVNIFGNLVGDIILPESALTDSSTTSGTNQITAENSGNGAYSTNSATVDQNTNNTTLQTNTSNIQNDITLSATTGDNQADQNTNGDSLIQTGNSNVDSQVLNVTNTNTDGGNIWLVLINKAGQWFGQILGAPEGSNFAGSSGTEFAVDANGSITASNSGNGSGSQNTSQVNQTSNNTTVQNNQGTVVNHVNISANSGSNLAIQNTGGDSKVSTGDANVLLNVVNFVNNNITGGRRLIVAVVNVFGSWTGNFVPPGQQPDTNTASQTTTNTPQGSTNSISSTISSNPGNNISAGSASQNSNLSNSQTTTSSGSAGTNQGQSTTQNTIQVAGFKAAANNTLGNILGLTDQPDSKKNNLLTINLAWILLIAPLLAGLLLLIKTIRRVLKNRRTNRTFAATYLHKF